MMRRLAGVPGLYIVSALLVLATLALVGFVIVGLSNSVDRLRVQYDSLHQNYEGLYAEAVTEGVDPQAPAPDDVPESVPQEPQIIIGAPGPQGERGFTGATGPQGRTGPPGETGPRGPLGPRGEPGKDSTVPGPAGIDGINGADGAAGEPGRGIQSMQCATGGWIVEYTDGISTPDSGPCQGPQGVHGEQGPQGAPGPQGTAKPGEYACPDGEVMSGLTIADDGTVTLACEDTTPPIIDNP